MAQELPDDFDPRVAAFVVAIRARFNRRHPHAQTHWDETLISRYLNGERHPPEEFLDCLPDGRDLRPLHRQALQARDRHAYAVLVAADRLRAAEGRLAALQAQLDLLHDDLVKRELLAVGGGVEDQARAGEAEGSEAGVGDVRGQMERAEAGVRDVRCQMERVQAARAGCREWVAELEAELASLRRRAREAAAVRAASLGMGERLAEAEARAAEAEGRMRLLESRLRSADEANARLRSELDVQRGFARLDARCLPHGAESGAAARSSHRIPEAWEVGLTHESWEWVRRHNAASDTPRSLYDGFTA
ncbi:hypothetical protein [Nonomuraea soli]|uniref:Uncharacterized protein n=1 Tax=Nonomuraea soli TaxID=1032476 RepID=A0A7W0CMW1_9ACTN|nr:hypothetical protein [Nonomuraea soli]MBA2894118.1 hypothetical protein [Nonomuraea soli]